MGQRVNITREKEVEQVTQELQGSAADTDRLTQKVLELDAAKTEFLTGISRMVHSTMNGVIGMLEIALDETVTDKVKDCLYTARSSANGLVAMMNDIVDISGIEAGEMPIERRHCSLSEVLLDMDSLLQAQMIERDGDFDLEIREALPATVYVDPIRLKQCLLDLVHSTTKELDSRVVTLGAGSQEKDSDHWITFTITHRRACECTGKQDCVCRRYWQRIHAILHPERRTDQHPNGADMGLMIAFKLSALLGGRLSLDSAPDEPIRLSLTVPAGMSGKRVDMISELHRHRPSLPESEPVRERHFFGRVLVADDDKVDRQVISAMLKKLGVNLVMVNSGKEVLQQARADTYDLLIVDMLMPDMDGCEVTHRLRADGLETPIVALTGNVMKPEIDACLEAGYTEHLPKPVEQTRLAEVLSRYLPVRQTQADSADVEQAAEPVGA